MKNKILLIIVLLTLGTGCTKTSKINMISKENQDIVHFTNQSTLGTLWMRDSGEYRALAYQAYNSGKNYLKEVA